MRTVLNVILMSNHWHACCHCEGWFVWQTLLYSVFWRTYCVSSTTNVQCSIIMWWTPRFLSPSPGIHTNMSSQIIKNVVYHLTMRAQNSCAIVINTKLFKFDWECWKNVSAAAEKCVVNQRTEVRLMWSIKMKICPHACQLEKNGVLNDRCCVKYCL